MDCHEIGLKVVLRMNANNHFGVQLLPGQTLNVQFFSFTAECYFMFYAN